MLIPAIHNVKGDRSGGLDPLFIGIFLFELISHRLAGLAAYKFN